MKSRLLVALVVVAVVLLGCATFLATYKRDWVTETTPAKGEADYNPFFALERILVGMGQPASSGVLLNRVLPQLKPGDTLVMDGDTSGITTLQAQAIGQWVRAGGHLVFSTFFVADTPLNDNLGLQRKTEKWTSLCMNLAMDAKDQVDTKKSPPMCGLGFYLQPQAMARASVIIGKPESDGLLFARVPIGKGTVSLLSSLAMDVLMRDRLKHGPEQQFAMRLLAPNFGRGQFFLLYKLIGNSFWVSLFMRGWPALLASLLLVLGWMAMRSERLGPLVPAPAAHRRALLEHIHAVGEFLFRRDSGRSLHRLACDAILVRLHRTDPASVMLKRDELYAWLAQRSRLDAHHIENAFQSPANAAAFRGSMTTLARLRSHL